MARTGIPGAPPEVYHCFMNALYATLGILLGLFFVLAQVFAWVAVFQIWKLKKTVAALEAKIAAGRGPAPRAAVGPELASPAPPLPYPMSESAGVC